jgi:type IV pilus assembly protein PilV
VLVTIVILTFGLLGVAGLMFSGVSNVLASESATKATQLAADMADRIRANTDNAHGGSMSATTGYAHSFGSPAPAAPVTAAEQDVKDWLEAIKAQLPQGDGQIKAYNTGGSRKYTIEVHWAQCLGTLSKAETEGTGGCTNNPDAFKTVLVELRI